MNTRRFYNVFLTLSTRYGLTSRVHRECRQEYYDKVPKYKQDKYSANKITGFACTDLSHVNLKKTAHVPAVKEEKKTLYRPVDLSNGFVQWMIPFIIFVGGELLFDVLISVVLCIEIHKCKQCWP